MNTQWCWVSRTFTLNRPSFEPRLLWGRRLYIPFSSTSQALWLSQGGRLSGSRSSRGSEWKWARVSKEKAGNTAVKETTKANQHVFTRMRAGWSGFTTD